MKAFSSFLKKLLTFVFILALIATVGYFIYVSVYLPKTPPSPQPLPPTKEPSVPVDESPPLHVQEFEVGAFGPDKERKAYRSGSMTLVIPKLDYRGPVLSIDIDAHLEEGEMGGLNKEAVDYEMATELQTLLDSGVALFNQAQLPGVENRNVSIAGHRDFKGMEFFYIDLLEAGDKFYLEYEEKKYVYDYVKTFITTEEDWAPIATTDRSILTLQSCDPPFAANGLYDRIFVVAELVDVYALAPEKEGELPETENQENPEENAVFIPDVDFESLQDKDPSAFSEPDPLIPWSDDLFSA